MHCSISFHFIPSLFCGLYPYHPISCPRLPAAKSLRQERLAAAEANRAAGLARLQCRAAATSRRREGAAERAAAAAAERTAAAAERLEAELAAAESRRLALREAELERLRTEHELVLNRLVRSSCG